METSYSYVCNYRNGEWEEGGLTEDHTVTMSECAGILHYCQEVFEGLKAYTTENGDIVCFRPDMNAKRMADSARRLVMPEFPEDKFIEAVKMVVEANKEWVPPFGSARRSTSAPTCSPPGVIIGVKPADEYQFRILVTPVGPYFKGDKEAITITVADFDRAAPRGTGDIKAGLNYAMSLHPYEEAHKTATPGEPLPRLADAHLCRGDRRRQRPVRRQGRAASWCPSRSRTPSCPLSPAVRWGRWRKTFSA